MSIACWVSGAHPARVHPRKAKPKRLHILKMAVENISISQSVSEVEDNDMSDVVDVTKHECRNKLSDS